MLPKLLQKARAAPAPAPFQQQAAGPSARAAASVDGAEEVDDDYFDVPQVDEKGAPLQAPREGVVRSLSPRSREDGVVTPPQDSLLAQLGISASQAAAFLRDELLQERLGGRHEGSLAEFKHYYLAAGSTTLSNTEQSYTLCTPAGGTGVSGRAGNTICLRRVRIKVGLLRTITGTPTAATQAPCITIVVYRDKIPTTPGTAPTVHGTDANPPASATLIYSQLSATTSFAQSMPVRNPITEDAYHVYHYSRHILSTHQGYTYTGTTLGMPAPEYKIIDIDLELNDVQQNYTSYAAASPDTNAIYLCAWADSVYTNMGFTDSLGLVSDCEFYDKQI